MVTVEPADCLSLTVTGPFGAGLDGEGDNLILRALRALGEATGTGEPPLKVTLDKRLPIAAGLGGGSSDAGAALRLARTALGLDIDDAALETVATVIGADGPMCLRARSAWAEGIGDRLIEASWVPPLHAVLVNPGVACSTAAVYRAYDARPVGAADRPADPADTTPIGVIRWLAAQRNDLEAPALTVAPAIADALADLAACPGVGLVRMSGSGATVFALFERAGDADQASQAIRSRRPDWWIAGTVLG